MEKYAIIYPSEINEYHKKGYEFVTVFYEEGPSGFETVNLHGTFMNNPVNMSGNMDKSTKSPKFLMVLNRSAETLYGDNK